MPKKDQRRLVDALNNRDFEVRNRLLSKYNLTKEFSGIEAVYDTIHKEATAKGFDVGRLDHFYNRSVRNPEKYLEFLHGQIDSGTISRSVDEMAKKGGVALENVTPKVQAEWYNRALRMNGGAGVGARGASIFGQRKIETVTKQLRPFYHHPEQAFYSYVDQATSAIEKASFFNDQLPGGFFGSNKGLLWGDEVVDDLYTMPSIGRFVQKLAVEGKFPNARSQSDFQGALRSWLVPKAREHAFLSGYRTLVAIDLLANPYSAMTQLGDSAIAMGINGFVPGVKANAAAWIGKSNITTADLGVDIMAEELRTGSNLKWLSEQAFAKSGFEKIDRVGKETLINSSLIDAQNKLNKGDRLFSEELKVMFGDKVEDAAKDIRNGANTRNTQFFAFNRLSDVQPISRLELPGWMLDNPNLRLMGQLKTFHMKYLDTWRNYTIRMINDGARKGDKKMVARGLGNATRLLTYFSLSRFGVEVGKDFLRGKITDISDTAWESVVLSAGMSPYLMEDASRFGPSKLWERA